MALTLSGLHAIASQYLLPAVVDRIMRRVGSHEFHRLHGQNEVVDWLSEQIRKERGEVLEGLICDIQEKSECPVCKTPVGLSEAWRCLRCATPHHRDCHEFARSCAIYGCQRTLELFGPW